MGGLQELKGELMLNDLKKEKLKQIFDRTTRMDVNENLRDAFEYTFTLKIDNKLYKATFNDSDIPVDLRDLIDEIKK